MSTSKAFPTQARVVIIGGGVIGCSTAYHLTKLGVSDVVLLERKTLTSGTTWHAAGLVTSACYDSETSLKLISYSLELYDRLEEETEQATGFEKIGYVQLASNNERLEELRRVADFVRGFGTVSEELSASEIKRRWPLIETKDVIAGFWAPNDGRTNPVDTTMALAKGARMGGARIIENTKVLGIKQKNGRVTGVVTEQGDIEAEYVVNCAGMWAREVGKMAGVDVPLHAAEHYYLVTEPFEGMTRNFPIFEDLDLYAYYREESGGLMLGLFEPTAAPWGMKGIPDHFSFTDLPPDWERMTPYLNAAIQRIPDAVNVGVKMLFNGPESFTPDKTCYLGEAPELANYFVAAGLNSTGVLRGGGVGRAMAHWIVDGDPGIDVTTMHPDRVLSWQNNPAYLYDRTVEVLGLTYGNHWPHYAMTTARGARKSPIHDRMAAANAYFGESMGWEYPAWFAPEGVEPKVDYTWGRQKLVRVFRRRTQGRPRGRGTDGPEPDEQIPGPGPRRGKGPELYLLKQRFRAGRPVRVHNLAQQDGRHRGRPDRHPPGRGLVPGGGLGHPAHQDILLAQEKHPGQRPRLCDGRHLGPGPAQHPGPEIQGAAAIHHQRGRLQRGAPLPEHENDRHQIRPGQRSQDHVRGRVGI